MKKKYPDTWILLLNPEPQDGGAWANNGQVAFWNIDKRKVAKKAAEFKQVHFAMIYTGDIKLPEGTVICL